MGIMERMDMVSKKRESFPGLAIRNLGLNQALSLINSVDKSLWRKGRSVSVSSTLNGKKSLP